MNLEFINPQILLIQHFVILGILVTLISISSSLSKEVRYKFIRKYFWVEKYFLVYLGYFLLSFLITAFLYSIQNDVNINNIYPIIFSLFLVLFFWTIFTVTKFLQKLDRDNFNRIIIKKIKESFLEKGEKNEPLEDFFSNLLYIIKNNLDIDCGEREVLQTIFDYSLKTNQLRYIEKFFEEIIKEEKDFGIFSKAILSVLYKLKRKSSIGEIRVYQNLLLTFLKNSFSNIKEFSRHLNTSGLYIKEFLDKRYEEVFEKTINKKEVKDYEQLILNTINSLYELNKYIINLKIEDNLKYEYLSNQIPEFNKCLENYNYIKNTDFLPDYYEIISKTDEEKTDEEKEKLKLLDVKLGIINKTQKELLKKQLKLFYIIFSKIDRVNLGQDFFKLAYKFFQIKGFKEKFNEFEDLEMMSDLDWENFDTFSSNAGFIPRFPIFKYRIIIYFYEYLQDKKSLEKNLGLLKKENYKEDLEEIKDIIFKIDNNLLDKFFDSSIKYRLKDLALFKKRALSIFEEEKKKRELSEREYIANTSLEDAKQKEHKEKFEKDCLKIWEENQEELKKIFNYKESNNLDNQETFFGQYILYPKVWFLESYYKNVGLNISAGEDLGRDQSLSKKKKIFEEINTTIKKNETQKIKKFEEIKKFLTSSEKDYYLIYGKKFDIYTIKDINWIVNGLQTAEIKIDEYTIHFIHNIDSEDNILFEKNAFILEQNKKGFKDLGFPLFVEVKDLSIEQVKQILSKDKTKEELDIKQNVVIRIAEKFDIKRDKTKKGIFKIIM